MSGCSRFRDRGLPFSFRSLPRKVFTQRRKGKEEEKGRRWEEKEDPGKENSGKEDGIQKKRTSREANPKTQAMSLSCSPLVSIPFVFLSTIFLSPILCPRGFWWEDSKLLPNVI